MLALQAAAQQALVRLMIQLWFRGLHSSARSRRERRLARAVGLGSVSSVQMVMLYVNEAERLSTIERNDILAALKPERAVLAKQAPRKDAAAQNVYDIAIQTHARIDDHENIWYLHPEIEGPQCLGHARSGHQPARRPVCRD